MLILVCEAWKTSFLSRVDGGVEWPLGHRDLNNNDLREVSSQDLLAL